MSATRHRSLSLACLALAVTWCAPPAQAQSSSSTAPPASTRGVLLLAHGGNKEWNANVRDIAAEVNKTEPTEVAFGMADRATLQEGIDKLTGRGVTQIVAVPLFVSSHSSVIEATKYLLGLRPEAPPELMHFAMDHGGGDSPSLGVDKGAAGTLKTTPVRCAVPLRMAAALDRHPILAEILTARAEAISREPAHEVLVLVAHGPNENAENELWLADLRAVAKLIEAKRPFAMVEVTTVRDDADAPIREQATRQFRSIVSAANERGYRVLVAPVLLSYGGIENGIRQRLDGLEHVMSPNGLLPDPRVSEWVIDVAGSGSGVRGE